MGYLPSPSYSINIRVEIDNKVGMFARVARAISRTGGDLGYVTIVEARRGVLVRDITVNARDEAHEEQIVAALETVRGVRVVQVVDHTFSVHEGGKITVSGKTPIHDSNDLARVYTPGVARVCRTIENNPDEAYRYTIKGNTVAIVTDGSAVLGLGNIGPVASLPVMEGKAMIFQEFAGINAFPLPLTTQDPEEIIETVKRIAPALGGINLEDIAAPRCFEVETRLQEALDIPVFHDDQHGTAVVVLAGLINVGRLLRKKIRRFRVVIAGAGAAGIATANLLLAYGIKDIVVCDRTGGIYRGRRTGMNSYKKQLAYRTNPRRRKGSLKECLAGADVFIGVSGPDVIDAGDVKTMARDRVVFALANPDPEVAPESIDRLVRVLATGRSDYPNQVNNMLAFPGIFRGLLDVRARSVNDTVRLAAADAIARVIPDGELHADYIIPSIFDRTVVDRVATAVSEAARSAGLA